MKPDLLWCGAWPHVLFSVAHATQSTLRGACHGGNEAFLGASKNMQLADILVVWGKPKEFGESLEKSEHSLSLHAAFYVRV